MDGISILTLLLMVSLSSSGMTGMLVGQDGPQILDAQANPIKVRPGENLAITVEVHDILGPGSAVAEFPFEGGSDYVDMFVLHSSDNLYTYQAVWTTHDTIDQKWYTTKVTVTDKLGRQAFADVEWQDPTQGHSASQVRPGTFGVGNYEFPDNLTVGGTDFFVDNSTGNVGIGTASPSRLLTIYKNDINTNGIGSDQNSVLRIANPFNSIGAFSGIQFNHAFNTDLGVMAMVGMTVTDTTGTRTGALTFATKSNNGATDVTEYMRISPGGNVGIGTTNPAAKLEVTGVGSGLSLNVSGDLFVNDSTGNVGIGTTSPTQKLEVFNGGLNISNDANGTMLYVDNSTGNVGIGTKSWIETGLATQLLIHGDPSCGIVLNATRSYVIDSVSTEKFFIYDMTAGAFRIAIDSSGNVGIGESSPDSKLEVTGTIHATNLDGGADDLAVNGVGQIVRKTSDERLKENIQIIDNALYKVSGLRGVSFNWINKTVMGSQNEFGMIAQEVEKTVPELATTSSVDGIKSVKYSNAVALLVNAINEQQSQIEQLKAENQQLIQLVCLDHPDAEICQ